MLQESANSEAKLHFANTREKQIMRALKTGRKRKMQEKYISLNINKIENAMKIFAL